MEHIYSLDQIEQMRVRMERYILNEPEYDEEQKNRSPHSPSSPKKRRMPQKLLNAQKQRKLSQILLNSPRKLNQINLKEKKTKQIRYQKNSRSAKIINGNKNLPNMPKNYAITAHGKIIKEEIQVQDIGTEKELEKLLVESILNPFPTNHQSFRKTVHKNKSSHIQKIPEHSPPPELQRIQKVKQTDFKTNLTEESAGPVNFLKLLSKFNQNNSQDNTQNKASIKDNNSTVKKISVEEIHQRNFTFGESRNQKKPNIVQKQTEKTPTKNQMLRNSIKSTKSPLKISPQIFQSSFSLSKRISGLDNKLSKQYNNTIKRLENLKEQIRAQKKAKDLVQQSLQESFKGQQTKILQIYRKHSPLQKFCQFNKQNKSPTAKKKS